MTLARKTLIQKHLNDEKLKQYPDNFSNGVKGFAELIVFFCNQARYRHPEETRNDRNLRYMMCYTNNTKVVEKVIINNETDILVEELKALNKTTGLIMDYNALNALKRHGLRINKTQLNSSNN